MNDYFFPTKNLKELTLFKQVTDWRGSQIDLGADQVERRAIFPSGGVLVTNGSIHHQIVELSSSSSSNV